MNLIEQTRLAASAFHDAAVKAGADPYSSYEFVLYEANRRDIEVSSLVSGSPLLQGGRALIDIDSGIIYHEKTGDPFMDAFLVAHEIGHAEYGGHLDISPTFSVDPSRSSDPSATGLERVVDYSGRSRQELQMDLFAREFLFPRNLARKLHIEQKLSAAEISRITGVLYNVVCVQLFDALFLPVIPPSIFTPKKSKKLNPEQSKAASHFGSAYLLKAGPGTGKTQTLIGRLEALKAKGVDPAKILVLTFSNKAAGELSLRAGQIWPEAAGTIWIGTFHSFGLDIVKRFHDRLGLPTNPELIDQTNAIALIEDRFANLDLQHFNDLWDPIEKIRDILSAISRAKDEVVDAVKYRELSQNMLKVAKEEGSRVDAEKCSEIATVYEAYEELKSEQGKVDFGDLVALAVTLLENDDPVRRQLQSRYEHILVDEYQDVNRASVRLLKALKPDGANLWVVGDAKQSIYRFRGASSYNVSRFATEDFLGGKMAELSINYRSYQEVCDTFSEFARADMKVADKGLEVTANRGSCGRKPVFVKTLTRDDEIAVVAKRVLQARDDGTAFKDQAILCKGNDRLGQIAVGLEKAGVPVLFLGPLFDRPEIKEILSILALLVDPRAAGLYCVANMPEFSIPLNDVSIVANALRKYDVENPLDWVEVLKKVDGLSTAGREGLSKLTSALNGLSSESEPWSAMCQVLFDDSGISARIFEIAIDGNPNPGIAIWQLQNFFRSASVVASGYPISSMLNHIRRLVILSDERELRNLPHAANSLDAVRILTMHGSKGLEFKLVHLPSLTSASLPRSAKQNKSLLPPDGLIDGSVLSGRAILEEGHDEEQECLFFVALSRAEDALILYSPSQQKGGRLQKPSPFIKRLGTTITDEQDTLNSKVGGSSDQNVEMDFKHPYRISASQLSQYKRCPRRFFLSYILKVGGSRTETPFMKMHDVVQSVVDDLCSDIADNVSSDKIDDLIEVAWKALGPIDHGYAEDYRKSAERLIKFYISVRPNKGRQKPILSKLEIGKAIIDVRPSEAFDSSTGLSVFRKVRTGRKTSTFTDSWEAAAFQLACEKENAKGEFVFLSDENLVPLEMKVKKIGNRQESISEALIDIESGKFPPIYTRNCPKCPHFLICSPPPSGRLKKKYLI